jgi:hypothetical protein
MTSDRRRVLGSVWSDRIQLTLESPAAVALRDRGKYFVFAGVFKRLQRIEMHRLSVSVFESENCDMRLLFHTSSLLLSLITKDIQR